MAFFKKKKALATTDGTCPENIKDKANTFMVNLHLKMADKSGGSLWEYLLVIVIVCVLGSGLISVITGSGGIASLWNGLYTKFTNLVNTAP